MVWTLLCIAADVDVIEVTNIPGEVNGRCDRLSRRGLNLIMSIVEEAAEMGITGARVIEMNGDKSIRVSSSCVTRGLCWSQRASLWSSGPEPDLLLKIL